MSDPTTESEARRLQSEYLRAWRKRNKAKVAEYNRKYWIRRAERQLKMKKDGNHETTQN